MGPRAYIHTGVAPSQDVELTALFAIKRLLYSFNVL